MFNLRRIVSILLVALVVTSFTVPVFAQTQESEEPLSLDELIKHYQSLDLDENVLADVNSLIEFYLNDTSLPYIPGSSTTGHYIVLEGINEATLKAYVVDPHWNSSYRGKHEITLSELFNAYLDGPQYIIYYQP